MIIGLIFLITISYLILIGCLIFGFDKVPEFRLQDKTPRLKFSIVIPFRNESHNFPRLIKSLHNLNYPKTRFEVILINDESTDQSMKVVSEAIKDSALDIKVYDTIRTSGSPKKDAVSLAISKATNDWIVSTDADCSLPTYWLDVYDEFLTANDLQMAAGPVMYNDFSNFLKRFQALDVLSLQASTIGGFGINKPFLCNAANLCYSKTYFHTLQGFVGNDDIASGDDIFLLQKALKEGKDHVGYLKSDRALVFTKPENSWKGLIHQRRRWASKTRHYKNAFGSLVGMLVFLMNAALICTVLLTLAQVTSYKMAFYVFFIKLSIDFLMLYKSSRFFNNESLLATYPFAAIIYPFFNVYVAFTSSFRNFKWKERQFSK